MNKDILAKLLATENITVVHENAPTASFNVKERVLTLPLWDNLDGDNYDHFIGHEVGHALFTPEEGWHGAVCNNGRAYKTFLNVVEDARIERLIQNKYPGLRRNFIKSYRKLLADGFFGADLEAINNYSLIDRINCYFKLGQSAGVRIEKDEQCWIKEIEECVTWEEVVDITDRLFAYEKQKFEEMKQTMEDMGMTMNDEMADADFEENNNGDYESFYDFDTDGDGEEEGENGQGSESEEGEETEETEEGQGDPAEGEGDENEEYDESYVKSLPDEYGDEPYSKTEESLHENIEKEYNNVDGTQIHNLKLGTENINDYIIGYKNTLGFFNDAYYKRFEIRGAEKLKEFQSNNRSVVNYMVKEFEMKKKASEYARTSLAKTGVIDPVKMNGYKFSDDIFRKVAVTPQGKNHGLVMYVDWSGSMCHHMKPTIDQVLNLVFFCRQVNIPYRVYMFTDRIGNDHEAPVAPKNTLTYKRSFRLVELFNNRMNRTDFNRMAGNLLMVGSSFERNSGLIIPSQFMLGGTPLDDAIMGAIQIHDEFKKSNRLDIVNTVFLTDGDSHTIETVVPSRYNENRVQQIPVHYLYGKESIVKILDPVTKKQYRIDSRSFGNSTIQLLKIFRDRTGSNAIGYRITTMNRRSVCGDFRRYTNEEGLVKIYDDLRKNRFSTIPNSGYDKFFVLAGGKYLETSNTSMEVAEDATKGQIRTAFKKANGNRKSTRVMLSQFIDMVA
jgi:hypothetical protein